MPEYTLADENVDAVSAAFGLLSSTHRRGVLYAAEHGDETTVEKLAHRIASGQSEADDAPSRSSVRVSLVHTHLPKLADAGVVEYDRERDTVELTDRATDLEPYLACTHESEQSMSADHHVSRLNA